MRRSHLVPLALVALFCAASTPLDAQGWKERLKAKAAEKLEKAGEKAVDKATGEPKEEQAEEGKTTTASQQGATKEAGKASRDTANQKPGEGAWANYDFVPGARVLFADDFSRERVGNFPRRFELGTGNAEVVEWQGRRWLRVNEETEFAIPLPEVLPERFTVEFEATLAWNDIGFYVAPKTGGYRYSFSRVQLSGTSAGLIRGNSNDGSFIDPRTKFEDLFDEERHLSRPLKVRVQVDGNYFKVYMDQVRVANIPNVEFTRANKLIFFIETNNVNGVVQPPLLTNFSINAGGRDMYDALMADGRVALQGIYFDTGSDRIRPESSGQLREIADMLAEHADLNLLVEGHTDNVGDAAANQTLSEKRATAVKAALVSQYKVDAARLTAQGFGASKPAAQNTTPEGRQQNRRVELVKR
ncbi:MAG TPA: OmpA family protein [Gemmatimonadaceae bacterium]|nr:OmpA family protein [Gemmatimonadaceae bacterium]